MAWFTRAALIGALFCALIFFGAPPALAGGTVKGKITFQGKALEGATVSLYSVKTADLRAKPDFESAPTAADGAFEVPVGAGQYFLIAQKRANAASPELVEGDYYAYYGGNPVVVGEGEAINIGVNCAPIVPVAEKFKAGGTGIKGKILSEGKPLARARVTLYQDAVTIFRGIGYASAMTNDQGEFSFSLEPGDYYVIARKRVGEERMGPLSEGDFFGFAHENPVKVEQDKFTMVAMNAASKMVKVKEGGQDITLGGTVKAGETQISGVVKDREGKPVAGVYASAYRDSMMTMKPDFISRPTGVDGAFSISLSEGGEYFIGARNTLGGPAERGDLLGRYAGNEDHVVKIKTGEKLGGIDITVEPVE